MKCFVIREYSVSNDAICSVEDVLDELNIEKKDVFSLEPGERIESSIKNLILDSDFVIAILTRYSANVLFEIGLAVGSNKSVFLLVEENIVLPFDLTSMPYIKINDNLRENLLLPLKYFIQGLHNTKNQELVTHRSLKSGIDEKRFLRSLQYIKTNGSVMDFAKFVEELFIRLKAQYTILKFSNHADDVFYDFALWIDELEGNIHNPILFDLKFGKMNQSILDKISSERIISSINYGQMVIVLYCDTGNTDFSYINICPNLIIVNFEKFMLAVFKYGLPKSILLLRNSVAHGGELEI